MPEITFRGTPEEVRDIAKIISETFADRGRSLIEEPTITAGQRPRPALRLVRDPEPPGDTLTAGAER